ncbi:MAG: UDP-N-acetylmuramoyl-L-alanine--D-glutamate ligase [Proteobacteria bacterium]|nr:UDP-N-acetylmuramoyl-L-alanine--D-glutamate ligase [Pseudomonadota bacterium]
MTPVTVFNGKTVALFGLGGSGLVTAEALKAGGADVRAWDDNASAREAAEARGITLENLKDASWDGVSALVLAPGVPLTHPVPHWSVDKAKAAGVEIIGDIELFCRERKALAPDAPFVAITGTNGKSTTTALIAHLLTAAGRDVQLGGNIGTAILALQPPAAGRIHVIEVSSFQIDLAPSLAPSIGVMMNLTVDHIDRHGTVENYAAIKERMVAAADLAVIGIDDDFSAAMARHRDEKSKASIRVSVQTPVPNGLYAEGSRVMFAHKGKRIEAADLAGIGALRGRHNAQNAAMAIAVVTSLGVNAVTIREGLQSFGGLAHRMEEIGKVGRVLFLNDSKATNADSTDKALGAFEKGIYWIAGGKAKEGGIEPLRGHFERIAKAYLIGDAAAEFAETLGDGVRHVHSGTLDVAVMSALEDAQREGGGVVLLSPACASYDQYKNYEQRGDHFRVLVEALPGFVPKTKGA